MYTPAHVIFGLAAFGKPGDRRVTGAALAGALLPDLSLYLMAGGALGLGIPPGRVFNELYFSDAWQQVFAVDNSFVLWGLLLGIALWLRKTWLVAFAGAGLLHLATDFPLHHDDSRRNFWPLTDWVFHSPFSYWDKAYHAGVIGPIEVAVVTLLAAWSLVRFKDWRTRLIVCLLLIGEWSTGGFWSYIFS